MTIKKEKKVDIKYLGYKSEFTPPPNLPFGRGKYTMVDGERIDLKGTLKSTTLFAALVVDGVIGEPFEINEKY